jgi:hypothetical protein
MYKQTNVFVLVFSMFLFWFHMQATTKKSSWSLPVGIIYAKALKRNGKDLNYMSNFRSG